MTLVRRARREVYRVYGEEEFFACAARGELPAVVAARPASRRLRRVARTTMLLAATGAVGGLVGLSGRQSVSDARRRIGGGLLAATSPFASAHGVRVHARRDPARVGRQYRRAPAVGRAHHGRFEGRRGRSTTSRKPSVSIEIAAPPPRARIAAAVSAQPPRTGQSEFGFER